MALPPPPTPSTTPRPTGGAGSSPRLSHEPEIVVMPEKYYGAALTMKVPEVAPVPPPPVPKPQTADRRPQAPVVQKPNRVLPAVLGVVIVILLLAGGFVYFNQDLLFPKKTPTPPVPQVQIPSSPANLVASVASGTTVVVLNWTDTTGNETGFRLERRDATGSFAPLTSVPANSTAFQDATVRPLTTYAYRVFTVNSAGESSASNEASVAVPALPEAPPTVPALPPGGLDSDSDGLTDVEEPLYGTDRQAPDTDHDKFLDGNEVFHLYNPAAEAPIRLLDSGLVTEFSSAAGWALYVPHAWTTKLTTADGSTATVDTGHGEQFFLAIEPNVNALPLVDWYVKANPDTAVSSLRQITTKGGLEGILSPDRLTAYFAWDGHVFSIRYDIDGQTYINFRTTFEMMLNSLRLSGAPIIAPSPERPAEGPGALLETGTATSAP